MHDDFWFRLGRPLAPLYGLAMRIRALGYRRGTIESNQLPVPVISVGNLLMGGTGKTPLVQYVARLLQNNHRLPAIISRGYGGRAREPVNVVSDSSRMLLDARQAGDEPRLLAETLPGVPVLTGVQRRLPAAEAIRMGADVLVLDDGFQHLAVRRDVDLVLFKADHLLGDGRVFPGGRLREPVAALDRATAFVLTAVNPQNRAKAESFATWLGQQFPGRPTYLAAYVPEAVLALRRDGGLDVLDLQEAAGRVRGKAVFAFCGIADPDAFARELAVLPLDLAGFRILADHQDYTPARLRQLRNQARRHGAEALFATEKDLVKIAPLAAGLDLPLYALRMAVRMDDAFGEDMMRRIRGLR